MSALYIQDILTKIKSFLTLKDFLLLGSIDKSINTTAINIIAYTQLIKLNYSDTIIQKMLQGWKLRVLDLSNTMITDDFSAEIIHCHKLVVHHCYNITDKFIDKIPNCNHLDISYCTNINGSFVKKRNDWEYLKLSGCFFIKDSNLKKLNCLSLDLSNTIILYEFCKNDFHENHPFVSALKKCKNIYISKSQTENHSYVDRLLNILSTKITYGDAFDERQVMLFSQLHRQNVDSCVSGKEVWDFPTPKLKFISINGVNYEIPYTFNPPCFISICENDDKDIDTSVSLLKKYLLDRESYLKNIITMNERLILEYERKKIILSGYTFASTFINLMNAVKETFTFPICHEIVANRLFFRKYLVAQPGNIEEGFLGPDYIDSMFFTPSTTYVSPNINNINYSFLPNQEYTSDDVQIIHQNPKLNITWKHIKGPFNDCENVLYNLLEMINNNSNSGYLSSTNYFYKYRDFDKPNYSMLKYMDIMKTMEKEFMPQLLSNDEWVKALDVKFVKSLSRDVINERINDRFKETNKISELFRNGLDKGFQTLRENILPYDLDTIPDLDIIRFRRDGEINDVDLVGNQLPFPVGDDMNPMIPLHLWHMELGEGSLSDDE